MPIELPELPELTQGEEAAAPPPPQTASLSLMQTVLATAVVTVMAAAMGALFAVPPPAPPPPPPKSEVSAGLPPAGSGLFEMPPIVTNLGAPKDTWIRLEASIVFDAKASLIRKRWPTKSPATNSPICAPSRCRSSRGRSDCRTSARISTNARSIRSSGKVSELIIRTLVVQ